MPPAPRKPGSDEPAAEQMEVKLEVTDSEDTPVFFANHFVFQRTGGDECFLLAGRVSPPLITGTPEEQREQLSRIESVPVHSVARLIMTTSRARELVAVMQAQLGMSPTEVKR